MHPIEEELHSVCKFAPTKEYKKRQDYLAALARAVDLYFESVSDEGFDDLTDATANWFNAAARALSNKKVIPDFDDNVSSSEIQVPDEPLVEEPPIKYDELTEEFIEELLPDEPTLPVRKSHPPKQKRDYGDTRPPGRVLTVPDDADPTLGPVSNNKRDKWNFVIGTKNSKAASMLERGCRMADLKASIGGTYYSLLGKVIRRGHTVIHGANGYIKITYHEKSGRKTDVESSD